MKAFDGSTTYRDSVVSFLNINYYVLKEDYAKIVDMEERLTKLDNGYEVVSHLSRYGRESGQGKFSKVVYYSLYSLLGAYLLLLLFYFIKKKPLDA